VWDLPGHGIVVEKAGAPAQAGVGGGAAAAAALPGARSEWYKHSDGVDVWFSAVNGEETVWSLPEGGVVLSEPTQWLLHREGEETWYSAVEGGETVWTLPEGGVVVNSKKKRASKSSSASSSAQ